MKFRTSNILQDETLRKTIDPTEFVPAYVLRVTVLTNSGPSTNTRRLWSRNIMVSLPRTIVCTIQTALKFDFEVVTYDANVRAPGTERGRVTERYVILYILITG